MHVRIPPYSRHVVAGGEGLCDLTGAFHQNCINDVEGAMLEATFTQPSQDRSLCRLTLIPQGIINVAAFFSLCPHRSSRVQIGLISQHNHEFSLLAIGSMLDHPRRDLARVECVVPKALADGVRGAERHEDGYSTCDKK